jgi:hypothetical protein
VNPQWQWLDFEAVFGALTAARSNCILIGGQACNFYSAMYLQQCQTLQTFIPFTSHDLDVYVTDISFAAQTAKALDASLQLAPRDNPSPVTAAISFLRSDGKEQFVQFMRGAYGVRTQDIVESALEFEVHGVPLRVMHPLFVLESKIHCLRSLEQTDRQDEKHARMAICFCACFVHKLIENAKSDSRQIRPALAAFEHIFKIAVSDDGLYCWRHYNLSSELALPRESLPGIEAEGFEKFLEKRLPQLEANLNELRAKYAARSESRELARLSQVVPQISS